MEIKKRFGVYYTPKILTDFASNHLARYYGLLNINKPKVLEPSIGGGEFVLSLVSTGSIDDKFKLYCYDVDEVAIRNTITKIKNTTSKATIRGFNEDFLFSKIHKVDLVIGNPPFVTKKNLSKIQVDACVEINRKINFDKKRSCHNIWPSFVVKSVEALKKKGVACLVLPAELLQVDHTESLRQYLLSSFKRIEIFSFREIIFEGTQQDVVLFIGSKKELNTPNEVSFYEVERLEDLLIPDYVERYSNLHRNNPGKWSNYILSDSDLNFLNDVKNKISASPIIDFCNKIQVGIVTAANDFFILNREEVELYSLQNYTEDIIRKSSHLNGELKITDRVIDEMYSANLSTSLIVFPGLKPEDLPDELNDYRFKGELNRLHERYKMRKRIYWYKFAIGWKGDWLFVKRSSLYPKMILNSKKIIATDSFYKIKVKEIYDKYSLFSSFHNTFTFIDCELKGRYYGGGVLELTPNEFKSVNMPYINQNLKDTNKIIDLIRKNPIEFRHSVDDIILSTLNKSERRRLNQIYDKLTKRRLK